MARTRAQDYSDGPKSTHAPEESKPQQRTTAKAGDHKKATGSKDKKRKVEDVDKASGEKAKDEQGAGSKRTKTAASTTAEGTKPNPSAVDKTKLAALLSKYGVHPLQATSLPKQSEPTPETVLSLLYLAMLTSARISHELAYKSLQCMIEAGYQDIETLKKSTWQERTEVLTKGGYTRYREKTATALGELAAFIEKEYGTLFPQRKGPPFVKPLTDFFVSRAQTTISIISSRKQTHPQLRCGNCSRKSKASARLGRTFFSTRPRVFGRLWHRSSTLGVWRRPSTAVSAAMWTPCGMLSGKTRLRCVD